MPKPTTEKRPRSTYSHWLSVANHKRTPDDGRTIVSCTSKRDARIRNKRGTREIWVPNNGGHDEITRRTERRSPIWPRCNGRVLGNADSQRDLVLVLQVASVAQVPSKRRESMNPIDRKIAELNIRRYRTLLTERFDARQRQTILNLLAEEETKLKELTSHRRINPEPKGTAPMIKIEARAPVVDGFLGQSHAARLLKG